MNRGPMHALLAVTNDITVDQRVRRTAAALQKTGLDVTVIGRMLPASDENENFPFAVIRMRLFFQRGPLFYAFYNIRLFFKLLGMKTDLIVANDLDTLPAVFTASRLRHKPLLYDSHELFTGVPELVHRPGVRKIWEKLEACLLPRIRYACTVSPLIAQYYKEKYGIDMEVIRNLPVLYRGSTQAVPALRQGNENIILYQGALNLGRGLEAAIRAMQFVRGIRLVLIGSGDLEESLKKLAESPGISGKVTFLGRINPDVLKGFTEQADLGISLEEDLGLNYRYAMPNKVFDYICSGVPVLVSDLPMLRTLVETHGIGKIAGSADPALLAGIFQYMVNSPEREQWKENLTRAAADLNWEQEEPRLLALISRALDNQSAG